MNKRSFVQLATTSGAVLLAAAALSAAPALAVSISGFTAPVGGITADDWPYCNPTPVTITGSGFVNDGPSSSVKVAFNGIAATTVQVGDDNTINVLVPKGATSGPITVTTAAGTATSSTNVQIIPCPGREGNVGASATGKKAALTSFSPASGKAGATVTIKGTGLSGATSVKFAGVKAAYKVTSATTIKAVVPAKAKSGKISVVTPTGTVTSSKAFTRR